MSALLHWTQLYCGISRSIISVDQVQLSVYSPKPNYLHVQSFLSKTFFMRFELGDIMILFQALGNVSFLPLSFLVFICQIIVVCASTGTGALQTATLAGTSHGAGPTQTAGPANGTYEQRWKSSPGSRGTSELLISCFATIGLAVWSSVILNIQMTHDNTLKQIGEKVFLENDAANKNRKSFFKKLWIHTKLQFDRGALVRWEHKALWAMLNVIVPELTFIVSLDEYRNARDLLRVLKDDEHITECREIFRNWNMAVGFYAVAGGFYV